ncbi:magnesium transporter [Aureimonas altamirensis DSM 21988]|uniref:Magnesium transporter MgtE n=2 Tax=Aureimonas altamirensis TaxID=370622 RepID=A0ABY1I6X3_9HYPH|nr:magnesium transporter [Aureimonas altamirensis DSM 21988]
MLVRFVSQGVPLAEGDMNEIPEVETPAASGIYDDEGNMLQSFMDRVREALARDDAFELREAIGGLHETELGEVLGYLTTEQRQALVRLMGEDFDYTALTEVDEAIRLEMIHAMPPEQVAVAVSELASDDAVYILEDLDAQDRDEILRRLPFRERLRLRRALEYPEESAGRRMQTEFVAVPPFWTVGQTIDYVREDDDLPETFSEVFVVDPSFKLRGAVALHEILRAKRPEKIESIMHPTRHAIPAVMDQEEAAQIFEQYDLLSAAVVDENETLVGVLTIDDIVDVIQEEAEEDFRRLGGVGDEEISDTVLTAARSRFAWLFVNLFTAFLAASVIGLFDGTIQQMVALAALMPIVASMGGNAAAQTMTVTVRAIATRDINIHNSGRILRREVLVGLLNGTVIAFLIGLVVTLWFGETSLGIVIAVAMIINMLAAALAGILIPLLLNRAGADPAIASAVFVTAVTDVVGFFGFLGLASWWFGLAR